MEARSCSNCKHHMNHKMNDDTCSHPEVTTESVESEGGSQGRFIYLDADLAFSKYCHGAWYQAK